MGMGCLIGGHRWETRCSFDTVYTRCKDCGAQETGTRFGGSKEHARARDEQVVRRHFRKMDEEEARMEKESSENKAPVTMPTGFGTGLPADASAFQKTGAPIKRVWITAGNIAGQMPIISAILVDGDLFITPDNSNMPRPPQEPDYAKQREAAVRYAMLKKELRELELTFPQLNEFD